MMDRKGISPAATALIALVFMGATPASSVTIYDNTTTELASNANIATSEHGDEVTLAGTARRVSAFEFRYLLVSGQGDETARVRFYANDGTGGEPGSLLFDSGAVAIAVTGSTPATVLLSGLSVTVPDTFTWAVLFNDLGVRSSVYDPPTIGSSDDSFYWNRPGGTGSWEQRSFASIPANFYARIEAVPEPTTAALLGVGLVGMATLRRRAARAPAP